MASDEDIIARSVGCVSNNIRSLVPDTGRNLHNTRNNMKQESLIRKNSHSSSSNLVENRPTSRPLVDTVRPSPRIQLMSNLVDNILLLSALRKVAATLLVETGNDLLQSIHGVVLHGMSCSLFWWREQSMWTVQ